MKEADGKVQEVPVAEVTKFSPEEEAKLVSEANSHKAEANTLFTSSKYDAALTKYDEAVAVCPNYLDYEVAVLKSNIAACHLKLEEWKDAVKSATDSLDRLDKLDKAEAERDEKRKEEEDEEDEEEEADDDVEEEIVSAGAAHAAPTPPPEASEASEAEKARQKRKEDMLRIRAKALMRRARARSEQGGWSTLAGAEEDYKTLEKMTNLSAADKKVVQTQLKVLPARTKAAQEKEMGEMWGKLKELGNGLLKPFGLSTDNFQMTQDEKTGGYSMNFSQGE